MTLANRSQNITATTAVNSYMPDMGPEDYAAPEYRLVQGLSDAHTLHDVAEGQYYCEATGDARNPLTFVVLQVLQRTLTLWKTGDRTAPICSSDDRITPRKDGAYPGPCKGCPGRKAGCSMGYTMLCALVDPDNEMESIRNQDLFILRPGSSSAFPFMKLWTDVRSKQDNIPWRLLVSLTSEKRTNDKGTFFVMAPTWEAITDGDCLSELQIIADAGQREALPEPSAPPAQVVDTKVAAPALAAPTRQALRLITKDEAQEIATICKNYNIDNPMFITAYIQNAFGKDRVMQLNTGELSMLKAWLHQNYQPKRQAVVEAPVDEDDLPF